MQHQLPHLSPPGATYVAPRLAAVAVAVAALAAVAALLAVAVLAAVAAMTLAAPSQS